MKVSGAVYGLLAEFADPDTLLAAARECRERYSDVEAYSPYPIPRLAEVLGLKRDRIALFTLVGGLLGGAGAYFLQWYSAVIDYPMNIGGRPLDSWPVFLIPTFEFGVLTAVLGAFGGILLLNGLPRLNHPLFDIAEFEQFSRDRFYVAIRSTDARFDSVSARAFLEGLKPLHITEVPR